MCQIARVKDPTLRKNLCSASSNRTGESMCKLGPVSTKKLGLSVKKAINECPYAVWVSSQQLLNEASQESRSA